MNRIASYLRAVVGMFARRPKSTRQDEGTYYDPSKRSKILGKAVMSDPRKR